MYSTMILAIGIWSPCETPDTPSAVRAIGFASTVRITEPEKGQVGTGVILGVHRDYVYVLTAAHLLRRDAKPRIETFAPGKTSVVESIHDSCEVVLHVGVPDLSVVRTPAGKRIWPAISLAPVRAEGSAVEPAWAIGCDNGMEPRLETIALVGRKQVQQLGGEKPFFWEAKGKTGGGRSGGPLLDQKGQLIGICSGTQEGFSYFSHLDEIRAALKTPRLEWVLTKPTDR